MKIKSILGAAALVSAVLASSPALALEKDSDALALERLLAELLGMPVEIDVKGEGGSIRIEYADLEQLDEICGLLQTRVQRVSETARTRDL